MPSRGRLGAGVQERVSAPRGMRTDAWVESCGQWAGWLCAVGCVFDVLLLLVYARAMYTGTFRGVFELLLL